MAYIRVGLSVASITCSSGAVARYSVGVTRRSCRSGSGSQDSGLLGDEADDASVLRIPVYNDLPVSSIPMQKNGCF
jgi:hypothetical protein